MSQTPRKKLILVNPVDRTVPQIDSVFPPLSLGILAALTPQSWEISLVDENIKPFVFTEGSLVAITSYTLNINRAYEIADIYRAKGVKVIMGGIHVSALPDEALLHADSVLIGIAEETWPQIIKDFESNKLQKTYHGKPSTVFVKTRYDIFDTSYKAGIINTSRGCSMKCSYCAITKFHGNTFNRKPIDMVICEMKDIPQKVVFFADDSLFGVNKKQEDEAIELFDALIEHKINKKWVCFASLNIANNSLLMKKATQSGCFMAYIGIETNDCKSLETLNKTINIKLKPENYNALIQRIQKHGIAVLAGIMYGFESENIEKNSKKAQFVKNLDAAQIASFMLTPLPGTTIYEDLLLKGKLTKTNYPKDWAHYNYITSCFLTEASKETDDLNAALNKIILSTYSFGQISKRALKTIWQTRSFFILAHSVYTNIKFRFYLKHNKEPYWFAFITAITKRIFFNKRRV